MSKPREWTLVVRGDPRAVNSWRWEVIGPMANEFHDDTRVIEFSVYLKLIEEIEQTAIELYAAVKERDAAIVSRDANERRFHEMEQKYFIEFTKSAKLVEALLKIAGRYSDAGFNLSAMARHALERIMAEYEAI